VLASRKVDLATKLREEAQSPFRTFRMFIYSGLVAAATIATATTIPRIIGSAFGAPNADPLLTVMQDMAINLGGGGFFGFLYLRDKKAMESQWTRIEREENLAKLKLSLANGKRATVREMRGVARVVVMAGPRAFIDESLRAAEPYKEQLRTKGCLLVPLVLDEEDKIASAQVPQPEEEDLRWRATALLTEQWAEWFRAQKGVANVPKGKGVYVCLRLDGRVRNSGTSAVPWPRMAVELPPIDSSTFLSGFDGSV